MLARISALPTPVKLVRENEKPIEERPIWYALDTGLLLRRLNEVEGEAKEKGKTGDAVSVAVHEWIKGLALELACQVDDPTDPAAQEIVESTKRRMRRYSHAGNASGKRGRPKTKKEDGK